MYKRYIKRDGKVYGPYNYHSKKVNGKVISEYKGRGSVKKINKTILLIFGLFYLIILIFLIGINLTGSVTLDINDVYVSNNVLDGKLELTLKYGEFIPAATEVIISTGNVSYNYILSDLIGEAPQPSLGNFSIKGKDISGFGEGYAIESLITKFPSVSFDLMVYKEEVLQDEGNISTKEKIGEDNQTIAEKSEDIYNETAEIPKENLDEEILNDLNKTAENEETTEETVESVDQGELELTGQSDLTNSVEGVEGVENGEGSISTSSSDNKDSSSNIDSDAKSNGDNVNSETSGDANSDSSPEHNSESGSSSAVTGNIIKSFFKQIYNLFFPLTGKNIQEEVIKGEITLIEPFIYNLSDGESAKIISSSEDVYLSVTDKQAVVTTSYIGADELTVDINLSDLNIPANEGELIISLVYDGVELTSNSKKIKLDKILLNETALNNTLLNDSLMNITVGNITITTLQFDAVLGQSVKWKKKISLNESMPINITLPKQAENITVYKIVEDLGEEIAKEKSLEERVLEEISGKFDESEENLGKIEDVREEITEDNYNLKENIPDNYSGSFTGFVIEIQEDLNTEDAKEIVIDAQNATEFEIEYETPAPVAVEQKTADGKEITISSNIHYENILAYTELPKETQVSSIRLYNIQNESKVPVEFLAQDTNNNSLADIVYWIVPSLSNQTYLLVIEISKAEHLDENRNYLENIYEQVKLIDGNWSPVINSNEYIRVTFEQELDSTRDITLYPRIVNGSPSIEVYEFNKTEVIAKFESLTDNQYNKVYLINLSGQQDTFDLRITNGSIEVDYIVDPYGGPNLSYVILNATDIFNRTDKNLTVYTDQDSNSSLKLIRNWNKNGNPMTILNMPFEGGSNATFTKDYSNYSNNGTVTGATWNSSGGYDGKGAYKFDGTNDIINASPNAADLIERPEYTVSLWFNAAGAMGSLDGIISKSSSSPFLWGFRRASATTVLEWYTNGSSNVLQSTLTPTANTWYHVALVFDNTVGKKIYINGVLNVNNTDKTRTLDNSDSLLIGTDYRNDNTRNFWGLIDDIIIFNESLSSEQINALYNNRTDLIVAQETEVGDIWQACITPNDGIADGSENCSIGLVIKNTPPTPVILISPEDNNITTNRIPSFEWNSTDDDGDAIVYDFNLTCYNSAGGGCSDDDRFISATSSTSYTITTFLKYLKDNNYYYNWTVRGSDDNGVSYGAWATPRKIEIQALLNITLTVDSIAFSNVSYPWTDNTTDNSPQPFELQNDGNSLANITINATNLWQTVLSTSKYYQYKIDNKTGEEGAFNWILSDTSWTNLSVNSAEELAIAKLNWSDSSDVAETDLLIEIPIQEGPGYKSSTVYFKAVLGE